MLTVKQKVKAPQLSEHPNIQHSPREEESNFFVGVIDYKLNMGIIWVLSWRRILLCTPQRTAFVPLGILV